jgi:hypothetical protein
MVRSECQHSAQVAQQSVLPVWAGQTTCSVGFARSTTTAPLFGAVPAAEPDVEAVRPDADHLANDCPMSLCGSRAV